MSKAGPQYPLSYLLNPGGGGVPASAKRKLSTADDAASDSGGGPEETLGETLWARPKYWPSLQHSRRLSQGVFHEL